MDGQSAESSSSVLNRRDVLKVGAATTAGVLTEHFFGPIQKTHEVFGSLFSEGNVYQRQAVFEDLTHRMVSDPTEENRLLFSDWASFNLAEVYQRGKGNHLAADLIRHFLYGKGSDYDITADYQKALQEAGRVPFSEPFPLLAYPQDIIAYSHGSSTGRSQALYLEQMLLRSFYDTKVGGIVNFPTKVHASQSHYRQLISANHQPGKLTFSSSVTSMGSADLQMALKRYAIKASGNVGGIRTITSPDQLTQNDLRFDLAKLPSVQAAKLRQSFFPHDRITLNGVLIDIYDRYDFDPEQKIGLGVTVADGIHTLGSSLLGKAYDRSWLQVLPATVQQTLEAEEIYLRHHQAGVRLSSQGYADNFKISALFGLGSTLEVCLPQTNTVFSGDP